MAYKENSADGKLVKGTSNADNIFNTGANVTISAGKGDDIIDNYGSQVSIDGGAGNDFIWSNGSGVTINAGKGNDNIYAGGSNELIKYSGGNDSIQGFDATDTLQIASGTMDTLVKSNGVDYFISVGENVITLESAALADKVNIVDADGAEINFKVEANLVGTDEADYLVNYVDGATIQAGKDNDKVYALGSNELIKYSGGNDSIDGFNSTDTLQIASSKFNSVIATNGSDYFISVGKNIIRLNSVNGNRVKIVNSKGKGLKYSLKMVDNAFNGEDGEILEGTANRDVLENYGSNVTISGYAGDDTITSDGSKVSINGDAGNDSIKNGDWNNYGGSNVTIDGGAGNDFIFNNGEKVSINAGDGNDTIVNYGDNVSINSGAGNDNISNDSSQVSIDAGKGNDYIHSWGSSDSINAGAGNDSVYNWTHWSSKTQTYESPDNVTIDAGTGNDYIENQGSNVTIDGGAGDDFIWNDGNNVSIVGGTGDDYIYNYGSKVSINGGSGNDYINSDNSDADKVTLKGGLGDDSIWGSAGNDKLYGQGGNDKIYGGAGKDSLWGGEGDDTLWGGDGNDTFIYTVNEDTDRIMDYEAGDMLKILNADGTDGSFKSSKYSDGDLKLTINGGGKVIFEGVNSGDSFNINGETYKISGSKLVK